MEIKVYHQIMDWNEDVSAQVKQTLKAHHTLLVNVMGSPGAGKTSLITALIARLRDTFRIGVIEGDITTSYDAQAIAKLGIPSVELNTDGACHIEAMSIQKILPEFSLDALDVLVGSVQRCHLGHARFQQQAHIDKIQCQRVLVLHAAQVQRVRKALGGRDHIGAGAPPRLHDALAGKQLHGFALRAAAHAELFTQLKFIGQLGSRLQRGIQNIVVNFVLHLFGKEFVFQMGKFAHGCSLPFF